ncbi:MAG: ribulose bisphosphate carboxylase small subunit [Vulcanimicrobiaceae bacterium]
MHITQGTFSYLPPLTDDEIRAQIEYALANDWPISIEHTDDPHPRNVYWEMYGQPMFDERNAENIMTVLDKARREFGDQYIKINAFDRSLGRQTMALSFIVNRPACEPGFALERITSTDRIQRYTLRSYALDHPKGSRYRSE